MTSVKRQAGCSEARACSLNRKLLESRNFGSRSIFILIFSSRYSGIAVRMTESLYGSPCLSGFSPSFAFLQNLPSVVASHVLAPRPGETILDMCAAPGE